MAKRQKHFLVPRVDSLGREIRPQTTIGEKRKLWSGYIGESLGHHLLHQRSPSFKKWKANRWRSECDLKHGNLYIEVKIGNTGDPWRFRMSQFEHQVGDNAEAEAFDPETPAQDNKVRLTFLFGYRGRGWKNGKRVRLLKRNGNGKSLKTTRSFILENFEAGFIVDTRLLGALAEQNGTKIERRTGYSYERLDFCRSDLKAIAQNAVEKLPALGYPTEALSQWLPPNAKRIRSRNIVTKFHGKEISFPLTLLVDIPTRRSILRQLNGQVRRAEKINHP